MPKRDYDTPLILGCLFPTFKSDAAKTTPVLVPKTEQKTHLLREMGAKLLHWAKPYHLR